MSWYVSSKDGVKARRPHRCDLCGERIAIGELYDTRSGVSEGDGFSTMHMHPECHAHESHETVDPDWYEDISEPAFERPCGAIRCLKSHEQAI